MAKNKSQKRITVSFPDNEIGEKLFEWVKEKSKLTNDATFIRQVLYDRMLEEEHIYKK